MDDFKKEEERINIFRIRKDLRDSVFGNGIVYHEVMDSTNSLAKELAGAGAPHGTVVITEEQLAGRGRLDRRWISPRGRNLMFSILLRPDLRVDQVFFLTMLLALSVRDSLKEMFGVVALIKWPNDIYISGKKTGGILSEFSVSENKVEHVIIGLGLNVNWHPEEEFEVLYPCTSVMRETGFRVERSLLLTKILLQFEKHYAAGLFEKGGLAVFQKEWNACSYVLGKEVAVNNGMKKIAGKAIEIDDAGALIIEDKLGEKSRILWGDVSVEAMQAS